MAEYQARLFTRTGTPGPILGVVPAYERGLNNTGKCTISLPLDTASLSAANTEPWANELLLLRRDSSTVAWASADVAWDGPIVDTDEDDAGGTITLTAGPVSAWMDRRNQRRTVDVAYGTPVDLDTVAAAFVYLAQHPEPPFGYSATADFGVAAESHPTGTTRAYRLRFSDRRNWLEVLNELASGSPSFDWDILTTWNGTSRTRVFRTYSPGRGSAVTTPLVRGRTLVGLRRQRVGSRAANYVESFGDNGTTLVSDAKQDATSQTTYGLLEQMDSGSGVNKKTLLDDRATEQLRLRKPPTALIQAGYVAKDSTPWRFATVGDTVPVRGSRGPLVVNGTYRIAYESVAVSSGGVETVTLTFQDPLS